MAEKVAVIGGGMAGLTAAYLLNPKYDVKLFEKDGRLGGNAYTLATRDGLHFDIAAAVFGRNSYPNFTKLLRRLQVPTSRFDGGGVGWVDLDTRDEKYLNWTWRGLAAQRFAMFRPRFLFPLLMSFRSLFMGKDRNREGAFKGLSMAQALKLLPPIKEEFLLAQMFVLCLVSSMYYEEVWEGPAEYFFGKMTAHRDFFTNPVFSLFQADGGTQSYVNALAAHLAGRVVLNSRIRSVARAEDGVTLKMEGGEERFDHVVFACNADQALALLEKPTEAESRLLGAWKYRDGKIVVHKDRSSFPEREHYNLFTFLYTRRDGQTHTSVNGHIRNLKTAPDDCPYISSQHPNFPIDPQSIEFSKIFRTPIYDFNSAATIADLPGLNGRLRSYYCGSHFGYGLHEDCVNSALAAAAALGVNWA